MYLYDVDDIFLIDGWIQRKLKKETSESRIKQINNNYIDKTRED